MMMVLRLEDNDDGDVERDNCDNDDDSGLEREREGGLLVFACQLQSFWLMIFGMDVDGYNHYDDKDDKDDDNDDDGLEKEREGGLLVFACQL